MFASNCNALTCHRTLKAVMKKYSRDLKFWRWKQTSISQVMLGVETMKEKKEITLHLFVLHSCFFFLIYIKKNENCFRVKQQKKEKLLWWRVISFNSWCLSFISIRLRTNKRMFFEYFFIFTHNVHGAASKLIHHESWCWNIWVGNYIIMTGMELLN